MSPNGTSHVDEVDCRRVTREDAAAIAALEKLLHVDDWRAGRTQIRSDLTEAEWEDSSFGYGLFVRAELVGVVLAYYEPDCRRIFSYFELDCPPDISAEECLYIADFMVRREYSRYTLRLVKKMFASLGANHSELPLYGFSTRATVERWQEHRNVPRRAGYRYNGKRRFVLPDSPHELFLVRFDAQRQLGQKRDAVKGSTVRAVTTQSAWSRLAGDWDILLRRTPGWTVLQSFDLQRLWWRHFSQDGWPMIVVVYDGERVRAIAPFWVQTSLYFGRPRRRLKFIGEPSEIGRPTILRDGDDREAVAAIFQHLFENDTLWDSMLLHEQPKDGVVLSAAQERCADSRVIASTIPGPPCPRLDVRGSWQAYLAGRPGAFTDSLEVARRALRQQGELVFATYDTWPEVVEAFEIYQNLEARRATAEPAAGPKSRARRAYESALLYEYGPKRRLHLRTLAVAGKPIAAAFGLLESGRFFRVQAACDPDYVRFSPERLLTAYELEDAHQRPDYTEYDFLDGVADATEWTSTTSETRRLYVYRRDALFLVHYAWYFRIEPFVRAALTRVGLLGAWPKAVDVKE